MAKLTKKQELFVKEYLIDLNATQAAIRAGYSKKTAQEIGAQNLSKLMIAEAIQVEMDKRAKRIEVNSDYVLTGITRVIERCEQAEPVRDKDGNETGEYVFNASSALKGYELLGKHLKLFTDKIEVEVSESLAERLSRAKDKVKVEG